MHCPYCGQQFKKEELFTNAQKKYLGQVVHREVTPVIADELRRMMRNTLKGPQWSFKAAPSRPLPPVPAPPAEPSADSQLQCLDCALRFQWPSLSIDHVRNAHWGAETAELARLGCIVIDPHAA
jgi:hypothetical protein